ncbi:MAG: iron-sulfur cluster repair di-iron protein [Methanomethylovorans sp. PtaU1.Bin093]|uniref:hemerythrin domain-containing protein n=1 Tax=Methanomethylovorans sp. PtaU1.Bin093 TaxID=1811679 RepID=UPI0009CAB11C|nr:hemerythrin domain-containing protein [Methanomethylovorans sp. PtaU1.Bin093]OPY21371.1 MAG: iron-sulfur cluster repair di-iron protein [Methanomethylovorans sp. PtaU1.Bin093]
MMGVEDLRNEHSEITIMLDILKKVCKLLDEGEDVDHDHLEQLHEFMTVFVDECHHGKEEESLFPTLESIDGDESKKLIEILLAEHETGRKYAKAIGEAISDDDKMDPQNRAKLIKYVRYYIRLLVQHIDKENNILFALAEKKLSGEQNQELFEEFEILEKEKIGLGKHKQLHEIVHRLADIYL